MARKPKLIPVLCNLCLAAHPDNAQLGPGMELFMADGTKGWRCEPCDEKARVGAIISHTAISSIQSERARIIDLLERQFASSYWSDLSPQYIINLIKGNN